MTTNLTAAMTFQFIINEDNGHYFTQNAALMNEPSLRSYIDQYADGGVNVISFCTNGMRASFRSRVLEAIWDALPPEADPTAVCQQWLKSYLHGLPEESPDENDCHDNWPFHAKLFQTAGLNPYRIWLDQCRRRGVKAWISFDNLKKIFLILIATDFNFVEMRQKNQFLKLEAINLFFDCLS